MGDLLEYFEAQSRNLDEMSASWSSPIPTNFTSVIKFNGVPILPPVMTAKRREEMLTYRRQAMRLENRRKSKQREKLVARVQSIVAEVEKEFALKRRSRLPRTARISQLIEKQNSRLSDSVDSSPVSSGTDVSSKWSPESVNSSRSPAGISKTNSLSSNNRSKSMTNINNEKTVKVEKSKPSNTKKIDQSQEEKSVNKSDKFVREQRTKIPAPVHTTKSTPQKAKPKASSKSQAKALSNLKKSSSMSSLPNPAKIPGTPSYPVPKPPSTKMTELQARRSNLLITGRISFSNPDLRDFDDDNSLSCKSESGMSRNTRRLKKSAWQQANQHSASDPDISRNEIGESQGFVLSPEEPILQSPKIHRLKKQHKTAGSNPELSSTQYSPEVDPEKFRQEFLASKKKKQQKSTAANTERKPSPSENKSQTKETSKRRQLPVEPKVEEPQSLNDYPSLDDCNSLPQEFSGLPLTSVKQQQIGQVLAKLSKHLNLQDTGEALNSTSSSSSTENNMKQSVYSKSPSKNKEEEKKQKYFHSPTLSDNSGNSGKDVVEASVSSFNQSGVNSSVMSSVGSVGTNQSRRMSPKGLKNTVHFSSFVTEISTSASQSVEDKISVRKMDITPSNSVDLTGRTGSANSSDLSNQGQNGKPMPKNVNDLGSSSVPQVSTSTTQPYRNNLFPGQPGSMLSKVALSPEESPGGIPKSFFKDQDVPFHVYTAEIEHNTSDKENENVYQKQIPADMDDKLNLLERELNKSCDQTYGNIFMLTGKRSNDSDDRSQGSTLKESQENVISGIQRNYFKNDIYSDANRTDFEKVMKVSSSVTGSSGHVMGDVSQSKHLTHGTSSVNNIIPPTGSQISPNIVPKSLDRHVRHGSYTLEHPSDALLKAKLNQQSPQYSSTNGNITKMNIGPESIEPVSISQNDMSVPTSESSEQNAKAEHIQRYLSQVQPHPVEDVLENNQQPIQSSNTSRRPYDIGEAVQSFTETLQSFETLTEDEMLKIQADHFNKIRQHLIEQQKQQLEELFVSQRREQMNLQEEIEMHHDHLREQQELFTSFSEQNNLSQFSANNLQNTSVNSYNDSAQNFMNPPHSNPSNPNISVNNQFQMIAGNSFASAGSQQPNVKGSNVNKYVPNSYGPTNTTNNYIPQSSANGYVPTTSGNRYLPNESVLSEIPGNVSQPVYSQQMPANYPTQQKPFSYISSPSLYFNPRDRDNESDISTFSRGTPKQSLKFNHSTPSPKAYKPVLHSPVKEVQNAWTSSTMVYPESAFDPRLQHCFDRVSACVKGYLTRRLLVTEKVQEVVKTISDTKCFARSFQAETPIKKGQVNNQDRDLLDRIIAQLQAALLDVHEIFFDIPVWERMQIIDHDRQVRDERRLRESGATTRSSVSSSQPRISSATLKAMERKRKAQEAESAVFGDIRPRSAPHVDERCQRESTDLSGPLRRHFQFLLSRALQPSHLSHSHNTSSQSGSTTARTRTRPKTAPSQPVHHPHPVHQTSNPSIQQTTAATAAPKTRKTASTVLARYRKNEQNHQRHQQHQLPQRGKSLGKPGDDEKFVGSRGQAQLHRAVCEKLMGSRARSSRQKTSEV
ncbi:serine-rich adhesin for platelets-like isoform X4 [Mytilus edulis]